MYIKITTRTTKKSILIYLLYLLLSNIGFENQHLTTNIKKGRLSMGPLPCPFIFSPLNNERDRPIWTVARPRPVQQASTINMHAAHARKLRGIVSREHVETCRHNNSDVDNGDVARIPAPRSGGIRFSS